MARDTATNTDRVLEIQDAAVDVDDERVEAMISESVDHAFDDMNERIWTEARMKSEELLPAVDQALAAMGNSLGDEEIRGIRDAAVAVKQILDDPAKPAQSLKRANQALDEATVFQVGAALEDAAGFTARPDKWW